MTRSSSLSRRQFLGASAAGAAMLTFGSSFWRAAYAQLAVAGPGPFGPLQPVDPATGLQLPAGFTSRIVARAGEAAGSSGYVWHTAPDGGAVFPMADGGWVYTSNSETTPGGAGAIRFAADGTIAGAYRILHNTRNNCAGGPTPWGTWLSCEEVPQGWVWECAVDGAGDGVPLPALGAFSHEAVAVDPVRKRLYLTEDASNSRLYRFTPASYPDLTAGTLEAAVLATPVPATPTAMDTWSSAVTWLPVSAAGPAAYQPAASSTAVFNGGEGIWYDGGHIYFTTKGDNRVWDLDVVEQRMTLLYDDAAWPSGGAPLTGVDNVTVSPRGDIFVAEDGPNPSELVVLSVVGGMRQVTQFARVADHTGTEITGPAFTPDGTRLYFSSQRGPSAGGGRSGVTYEVRGPFTGVRDPGPDPDPDPDDPHGRKKPKKPKG